MSETTHRNLWYHQKDTVFDLIAGRPEKSSLHSIKTWSKMHSPALTCETQSRSLVSKEDIENMSMKVVYNFHCNCCNCTFIGLCFMLYLWFMSHLIPNPFYCDG